MVKVESIVDPSFKSGTGKKGLWTLVKVSVDGKTATGFAPISIGDEVDLEYNAEYKNWNFKKIGPQEIPAAQTLPDASIKLLELIYDDTQKILQLVDNGTPQTVSEARDEDVVVEDIGDGPIDLSDIPF